MHQPVGQHFRHTAYIRGYDEEPVHGNWLWDHHGYSVMYIRFMRRTKCRGCKSRSIGDQIHHECPFGLPLVVRCQSWYLSMHATSIPATGSLNNGHAEGLGQRGVEKNVALH